MTAELFVRLACSKLLEFLFDSPTASDLPMHEDAICQAQRFAAMQDKRRVPQERCTEKLHFRGIIG